VSSGWRCRSIDAVPSTYLVLLYAEIHPAWEVRKGADVQKVVNPIGEVVAEEATDATWRVNLAGARLGVLCNGKARSAELLAAVARRCVDRFGVADVVWANKSIEAEGPGRPAPPEILDRMSSGVVAVLAASGD
jgi:hypothetical protein